MNTPDFCGWQFPPPRRCFSPPIPHALHFPPAIVAQLAAISRNWKFPVNPAAPIA
jgi:hypothetical protein